MDLNSSNKSIVVVFSPRTIRPPPPKPMSSKLSFSIVTAKPKGTSKTNPASAPQSSDSVKFEESGSSKVSFSIPSASKSKHGTDGSVEENASSDQKHYVTEFDSSKALIAPKKEPVIPPLPNSWRPINRMKNIELPFRDERNGDVIGFVVESLSASGDDDGSGVTYGLNVRQKALNDDVKENAIPRTGEDIETLLLRKLRYDISNLPDHRGMEEYEDMPVEGFGAAVLRGYGWTEGQGIGKNAKEDIKVKQYEKRLGTFGLGFTPEAPIAVLRNGKDSVTEKPNRDRVRSGERESRSKKAKSTKRTPWLSRQIRVRIVSKKFKGGKFYLKKGVIVDVVEPHVCDISMDEGGELLQGVDQDLLETALPRKGGEVLVLYDEHKGVCGNLVTKDLNLGVGVVEDPDSFQLLNVKLDQIAEFVGGRTNE